MLNALAFMENRDVEELPNDLQSVYTGLEGISLEDRLRYGIEEINDGINDGVTTGSFDLDQFEGDNNEFDDSIYGQFDSVDLESLIEGLELPENIEEYLPEEGNKQLEDPMC